MPAVGEAVLLISDMVTIDVMPLKQSIVLSPVTDLQPDAYIGLFMLTTVFFPTAPGYPGHE